MSKEPDPTALVSGQLGYTFRDGKLLLRAITHKSYVNEAPPEDDLGHNERLEFLGDSVLDLVISQLLMEAYSQASEGVLSRMRAHLVCERELGRKAHELGLGELLRLGKGEERSGGRTKSSLLANLFESVLGAVFLDGGLEEARAVATRLFEAQIEGLAESLYLIDSKSRLQEVIQQQGLPPPVYRVVGTRGPEHNRRFIVSVSVADRQLAQGEGGSKKDAEQDAARQALETLVLLDPAEQETLDP